MTIHDACVEQAAIAVQAIKEFDRIDLDYSQQSLEKVDQILLSLHNEGQKPEAVEKTVIMLGCYAGEVMRRTIRGRNAPAGPAGEGKWLDPASAGMEQTSNWPVVISANGAAFNPIGKAFKVVTEGEGQSLAALYVVAAQIALQ